MKLIQKLGMDVNGNKVLRFYQRGPRVNQRKVFLFQVQTNGNLPLTHRDGIGEWTAGEVEKFVSKYGTDRQKKILKIC